MFGFQHLSLHITINWSILIDDKDNDYQVIGVTADGERDEFSLYCIIEGQTFTRPLYREQYILDVTTDLQRQGAIYYLIFCR